MNENIFDTNCIIGTSALKCNVVQFPVKIEVAEEEPQKKKGNYKVGEKQEVYPFRKQNELVLMHEHFASKKKYRDDCMFIVGINVGLRAGDLLALTWGDVFPETRTKVTDGITIKEEKTGKFRTFYFNDSSKNAILCYYKHYINKHGFPENSDAVFRSQKGGSLKVKSAGKILKEASKKVGIKFNVGTHSMRKTFGYWQLKAHNNDAMFICHLQEMFNHSSPVITLRYCGLKDEEMEQYYNDVNLL